MRRFLLLVIVVLVPATVALFAFACSAPLTCQEKFTCPADPNDGGSDGSTIVIDENGYPCDMAKSARDEPCFNRERFSAYVSPTGNDAAEGTKAKPFRSISKALTAAKETGKWHVFVCEGVYDERIAIDRALDGARLHGAFACDSWAYDANKKVIVRPKTGTALEIKSVAGALVEDVALESADAAAPSESSIAALVSSAQGVILRRVRVSAGKGMPGASGSTPAGTLPSPLIGTSASDGGTAVTCPCANSGIASVGGKGGGASGNGDPGLPAQDGGAAGAGGATCASGGKGSDAAEGTTGAGANSLGAIVSAAWSPTAGTNGGAASPGQGGGGGGGDIGGGGGGGGCGGCGGSGGLGGAGAGASVGLLAIDSAVILVESAIATKDGGPGGAGAVGQAGLAGAARGLGGLGGGCNGGNGGQGGRGGAGGGGAGGVSIGLLYRGPAPTVDDSTNKAISVGVAGSAGLGGKPGVNDGRIGVAVSIANAVQL